MTERTISYYLTVFVSYSCHSMFQNAFLNVHIKHLLCFLTALQDAIGTGPRETNN